MTSSVTTTPTELNGTNRCDLDTSSSVIMSLDDPPTGLDDNTIDISITTSEVPSVLQSVLPTQTQHPQIAQALSSKAQVLPLVYIQTPSKLNKTNTNSVIVNTVPQFQLSGVSKSANLPQNIALSSISTNQSVILTPVSNPGKQLLLQKSCNVQAVPVLPVSVSNSTTKFTGTYLTMLKPVTKSTDSKSIKINKSKSTEFSSSVTSCHVIAPMPKISSNRLPITATTNSVQPKIAFMPLNINSNNNVAPKKLFNFNFNSENAPITVMCDGNTNGGDNLSCDEIISLDSPTKNEDKSYQLSITEGATTKSDVSFTITIPDEAHKIKEIKPLPKPKHGVSILKKSFSFSDRSKTDKNQQNSLIISPIPNSITTISDTSTKEVKITTTPYENDESVIVTEPKLTQKPERRRKSHFSYRKDYDEIEVTTTTPDSNMPVTEKLSDLTVTKLPQNEESDKDDNAVEDTVEIKLVNDNQDEPSVENVLVWEDGIGTLPGTDVKFQKNEFGLLEMVTEDEYKKILEKRLARNTNKEASNKKEVEEDLRCHQCGCYGLPSEFINTKYCSYDCQDANCKNLKDTKIKKTKKKGFLKYPNNESPSDDENSQDKFSYPWTCSKKGFSWAKYLDHIKAKGAPVKLFRDPFPYSRNGFRPGMKLEGVDPQHPSYYCVLTVAEVIGYRLRLHFDGYPSNYDFWVNADSMNIFPAGWCEKYGHILQPPPTYSVEDFNWNFYLKLTKSTPAPKHLFANRAGNAICPNGFRVGMKLEAVDRKNTSLVCVATITDMMDNRMLIHFDSWDDIYDYWADPTSPYIHPVGWCDQFGHNLTPPNDYPNPEEFTWEKYLAETKSVPAPVRAFKQRQACGFKPGMRLECVDKRVPQLIRVATVDSVKDHQIRISFDGWPDRYSYWVDDDSTDIHPVGWCHKTGHPLEPPLTPDDVYDFLECATVGCRGLGHIMGPKYSTHSSQKDCPYADENIDQERILPDRLLSPDSKVKEVVPVSREPKEKSTIKINKIGRPPKLARMDWEDENEKKPKRKYIKKKYKNEQSEYDNKKDLSLLINGFTVLPEQQVWSKHSKYLEEYVKTDVDPRDWTVDDVVEFVTSLPSCKDHGNLFSDNNIDGEALLMLAQQDLVDILKIKLGPAIKLYNSIVMLRQNVKQIFT